MAEFKLITRGQTQVKGGKHPVFEEFYEYEATIENQFARVKFCAHPTKAWCWMILFQSANARRYVDSLLTAFCEAGLKRGDTPFDTVIATLQVEGRGR